MFCGGGEEEGKEEVTTLKLSNVAVCQLVCTAYFRHCLPLHTHLRLRAEY